MKRLSKMFRIAGDYTLAPSYTAENDIHWANIYSALLNVPQELQIELQTALEGYSNDTAIYQGEHPLSICSMWQNQRSQELRPDEMTALTMGIIPEIKALNIQ
ncbi:MAG: hypothetical protein K0R18_221 [Bacillales bacterium]|nr:hypothetical protein [Bacillales bacterium]